MAERPLPQIFSKMSKDSEKHVKLVRAMEKKLKSSEAAQRKLKAAAEEASASLAKKTEEFNQLERKVLTFCIPWRCPVSPRRPLPASFLSPSEQKQALESLCRRLQDQRAKDQEPAEGAEGEGWSAQAESQGVQGSSEPGPPTEPSAEDGAAPNDAAPGTD